jgi:hypothetical protein
LITHNVLSVHTTILSALIEWNKRPDRNSPIATQRMHNGFLAWRDRHLKKAQEGHSHRAKENPEGLPDVLPSPFSAL